MVKIFGPRLSIIQGIIRPQNTAVQAEKNAKTLPQTGEKQNRASIIGLALASIAGLLGFGVDRKRKHN
ncbi:Uncharacterised protein [Chlamydia trachomatis]|nr:Uncharacterised protein [Chlamydia trachomatis]